MTESPRVFDLIASSYQALGEIPEDVHLLCPKTSEHDEIDYYDLSPAAEDEEGPLPEGKKQRLADVEKSSDDLYTLSLVLAVNAADAALWLPFFKERANKFLMSCHACVERWHRSRPKFLSKLREYDRSGTTEARGEANQILTVISRNPSSVVSRPDSTSSTRTEYKLAWKMPSRF
jgi:hypothetical protein